MRKMKLIWVLLGLVIIFAGVVEIPKYYAKINSKQLEALKKDVGASKEKAVKKIERSRQSGSN